MGRFMVRTPDGSVLYGCTKFDADSSIRSNVIRAYQAMAPLLYERCTSLLMVPCFRKELYCRWPSNTVKFSHDPTRGFRFPIRVKLRIKMFTRLRFWVLPTLYSLGRPLNRCSRDGVLPCKLSRRINFGSQYAYMDFDTNLTFKVQKGRGLGHVTQFRNFRTPCNWQNIKGKLHYWLPLQI